METEHNKTIYQKALTKFGVDTQLKKLSQELLELGLALSHKEEGRNDHNVQEEFADVEIMMEQLREILNESGVIDEWKRVKVLRLQGLLK